ncbi:hypothetical protein GCM10022225_34270 [Plantactinospora mayteni]|uniref:Uncharacterized protein n=1 Tax=Plantactinospora mayteni TaxID=566021 RepID=A0ABQ4EMU2_9ACTN|nr:hypothetical protein [Plantactinospora mayteni]GIG95964.1 hypothetical protein Pma05_25370 [Plantactinospora mayteni]
MRHLGSLVFGLVSAPIIWVLAGIGLVRFNGGISRDEIGDTLLGFVVIVVVAGLLAALLLPRWSPLGPAAAGLLFMAMALWSVFSFGSMTDVLPRSFLGVEFALTAPSGALSALLAVLLGATLFIPHRWRSPRAAAAGFPGGAGQPGLPGYPPTGQFPPGGQAPGQFPPGAPVPPGGPGAASQFPPGGPGAPGAPHPPNYGPSTAPNYAQSAPPNFGPAVPPTYGPGTPQYPAPPYNAPAGGAPHHGPPISSPPVPSAPPMPPTFSPLTPPAPAPRPGEPSGRATSQFGGRSDETTQFTGGPDDDGMDGATRRLGDR